MKIVALAGGVGAAKLLSGLVAILPPEDVTIVVNTGDDFDWQGLRVCPDLDTVVYTLAGLANPETGWGVGKDTFHALEAVEALGGPAWFRIGDRDLATHVCRTNRLRSGRSLTDVTAEMCRALGVRANVVPMTDDPVSTQVETDQGILDFQDYFVRRRAAPRVLGLCFRGIERARPAPGVFDALAASDAVFVCPSNPLISIGPILAVPGLRAALRAVRARVTAVSPIVAGTAVKGPAARMLAELGMEASALTVARLYADFAATFVLDRRDADLAGPVESLGVLPRVTETIMDSTEARVGLARALVEFAR